MGRYRAPGSYPRQQYPVYSCRLSPSLSTASRRAAKSNGPLDPSSYTKSLRGNFYPTTTFQLAHIDAVLLDKEGEPTEKRVRDYQLAEINWLEKAIPRAPDRLCLEKFSWMNFTHKGKIYYDWRPEIIFKPDPSIEDIWAEWTRHDGQLSVRELERLWTDRWKINTGIRQIDEQRRIITLIKKLVRLPNWTVAIALRFLQDRYPIGPTSQFKSTHMFLEALQATDALGEQILAEARSIPPPGVVS